MTISRVALGVVLGLVFILAAQGRSQAAPSCNAVRSATYDSFQSFWKYEDGSSDPDLATLVRKTADAFRQIGVDFTAPLATCTTPGLAVFGSGERDDTHLLYDMLAIYLEGAELDAGAVTQDALNRAVAWMRDVHELVAVSNPFFGTYTRGLMKLYTQHGFTPPDDLKTWYSDPSLGPTSGCIDPYDVPASILNQAQPIYPNVVEYSGDFVAIVVVTIAENGTLKDAVLSQSTGNAAFDSAALRAAMASKYSPRTFRCEPVESKYLFKVTFRPG